MDCFYTVSAFRDWHSLNSAHTPAISIDRSRCVWIKSALYQDFFFFTVVEIKATAEFPQNLLRIKSLVRNHKQET